MSGGINIGERIKEVLDGMPKGYTVTWFADKLHCDRRNVYDIFQRPSIDTELLRRICLILNHDFFKEYSALLKKDL